MRDWLRVAGRFARRLGAPTGRAVAVRRAALATLLFGGFTAWFTVLRLCQHYSFRTSAYDLSLFDYALYYTVRGRMLWSPFLPVSNLLSDHFSPALLLLTPLYWLHDGPIGLLVVQTVAVVASGVPLYLAATQLLESHVLAALLTAAYFGNRYLFRGLVYDFHPEMWLPVFFLFGLWLIELRRRRAWGTAVLLLAMLVKEDVPIYVAMVGGYCLLRREIRTGAWLLAGSAAYGVFVGLVGFPALFRPPPPFALSAWTAHGDSLPAIVGSFVSHPARALHVFVAPALAGLLATFGFLPLLSPLTLLPALPAVFVNLSADSGGQRAFHVYYAAASLPFLAWGTVRALAWIRRAGRRGPAIVAALALVLAVVNHDYARSPAGPARARAGHAVLAEIPTGASVAAASPLVPHLPKRECVFVVGMNWHGEPVEYVVLDERSRAWPLTRQDTQTLVRDLDRDPRYQRVSERRGYILFRRTGAREAACEAR